MKKALAVAAIAFGVNLVTFAAVMLVVAVSRIITPQGDVAYFLGGLTAVAGIAFMGQAAVKYGVRFIARATGKE